MLVGIEPVTVIINKLLAKKSCVVRGNICNDKNMFNPLPKQ